jgi:hypothetical protein
LAALLLEQHVGVASALQGVQQVRETLRDYLRSEADSLRREAVQLADDITGCLSDEVV